MAQGEAEHSLEALEIEYGKNMSTYPWPLKPLQIESERVTLSTLTSSDIHEVAEAINDPLGWFGVRWNINSADLAKKMLERHMEGHKNGTCHPLVYRVRATGQVAGITRFMRIEAPNKTLEIGGTWIAPKWRRTFVNSEVKLLLLQHCFEQLGALRIEFRVDAKNLVSQEAVKRIGAVYEGTLRHRQVFPDGTVGDGLLFSVILPEWQTTKIRLQNRLEK